MSFKKPSANSLTRAGNMRLPSSVTAEAVIQFYEALDCPRSLTAAILYRYKEYEQLLSLDVNANDFDSSQAFRDSYLATNYLSKSQFLKTSFDKKELAFQKFLKFETQCSETNKFFRYEADKLDESTCLGKLLIAMRRKITSILGPFDPLELFDLASWGPGVSNQIKGEETFGAKKFQCETGITRSLYPLVKDLIPLAYPRWNETLVTAGFPHTEMGNTVITVPKTSKIDRVIAVEPGVNLWFQLGLGRMLRKRLGRFGIDLSDQTRNQKLAYQSSKDDLLATVDFSSASDSIASELVEFFLKPRTPFRDDEVITDTRWFDTMSRMRSEYGFLKGKRFRWQKFSSMGNGFTFDLETLIFYAAACVCCEAHNVSTSSISVYGDDVILPSVCFETFSHFTKVLGFTVNPAKSFSRGPFRESCGSHYYDGVDCKPVYFENALTSPQELYNFANTIRLRSHMLYGCDERFRTMFYTLQKAVPKLLRFKVSASYSNLTGQIDPTDGGFISNFDEACPTRVSRGPLKQYYEGFKVKRFAWVAVKLEVDYDGLLHSRLSSMANQTEREAQNAYLRLASLPDPFAVDKGHGNSVPLRGRTRCVLLSTVVRQWYDLGPWI